MREFLIVERVSNSIFSQFDIVNCKTLTISMSKSHNAQFLTPVFLLYINSPSKKHSFPLVLRDNRSNASLLHHFSLSFVSSYILDLSKNSLLFGNFVVFDCKSSTS